MNGAIAVLHGVCACGMHVAQRVPLNEDGSVALVECPHCNNPIASVEIADAEIIARSDT